MRSRDRREEIKAAERVTRAYAYANQQAAYADTDKGASYHNASVSQPLCSCDQYRKQRLPIVQHFDMKHKNHLVCAW